MFAPSSSVTSAPSTRTGRNVESQHHIESFLSKHLHKNREIFSITTSFAATIATIPEPAPLSDGASEAQRSSVGGITADRGTLISGISRQCQLAYRKTQESKAKKNRHAMLMAGSASSKHSTLDVTTLQAERVSSRGIAEAVFLTTELLEQIIYYLPDKQLLVAQRVCRKFQSVISGSTLLQQKLFFIPADASTGWKYDEVGEEWIMLSGVTLGEARKQGSAVVPAGVLNPMLFQQSGSSKLGPPPSNAQGLAFVHTWSTFRDLGPSMHHPQASWRRMYLTQPPSAYAAVQMADTRASVYHEDGVKGAAIHEAGLALGQQLKWSFFWRSTNVW